jgi:hypothetical protein
MLAPATDLEAVNSILASIGESPVSTLEDTGVVDAAMALRTLREVNREVQGRGWHFNMDEDYPLAPTFPEGVIEVPRNSIRTEPSDPTARLDFTVRGRKLYDKRNHTYQFKETVKVKIVTLLPFEDIPQFARNYISIRAARIFQQNTVGSPELSSFKNVDEARALVQLKEAEAETADYNILTGNQAVAGVLIR